MAHLRENVVPEDKLNIDVGMGGASKKTEMRLRDMLSFPKSFATNMIAQMAIASWGFNQITQAITTIYDVWFAHKKKMLQDMYDLRAEVTKLEGISPTGAAGIGRTDVKDAIAVGRETRVPGGADTVLRLRRMLQESAGSVPMKGWEEATAQSKYALGGNISDEANVAFNVMLRRFGIGKERAPGYLLTTVKGLPESQTAHALAMKKLAPVFEAMAPAGKDPEKMLREFLEVYSPGAQRNMPPRMWATAVRSFYEQTIKKEDKAEAIWGDRGLVMPGGKIPDPLALAGAVRDSSDRNITRAFKLYGRRALTFMQVTRGMGSVDGVESGDMLPVSKAQAGHAAFMEDLQNPDRAYTAAKYKMDRNLFDQTRVAEDREKMYNQEQQLDELYSEVAYTHFRGVMKREHERRPGGTTWQRKWVRKPWTEGKKGEGRDYPTYNMMAGRYDDIVAYGREHHMDATMVSKMMSVANVLEASDISPMIGMRPEAFESWVEYAEGRGRRPAVFSSYGARDVKSGVLTKELKAAVTGIKGASGYFSGQEGFMGLREGTNNGVQNFYFASESITKKTETQSTRESPEGGQ